MLAILTWFNDNILQWLKESDVTRHIVSTLSLFLLLSAGRWLLLGRIRKAEGLSNDLRRRWSAHVRLVAMLVLLLGLMIIWGAELQAFALSVVAIAAAIVIATKELIMCISGALLKAGGRSFRIGDRIEIGALRGDVVDQTLLTTTILEVGPGQVVHQHTGRTVVLPNSIFLNTPVINETFFDEYVLHAFTVSISASDDWQAAEQSLLQAAKEETAPFVDEAREHIEASVRREGLESLSVDPRVTIRIDDPGKLTMLVRIPTPARRKGRIEQAIIRRYLNIAAKRARTEDINEG